MLICCIILIGFWSWIFSCVLHLHLLLSSLCIIEKVLLKKRSMLFLLINGKKNGIICLKEKKNRWASNATTSLLSLFTFTFSPCSKLTCVSEAMNKTTSRFPKIHWMACSSEKKETSSSFGFIAGLDQRILLLTAFAMHQTNRSGRGGGKREMHREWSLAVFTDFNRRGSIWDEL